MIFKSILASGTSLVKRKSKISIQFEELTRDIKEYDKLMKEEFEEENLYDDFESEENNNNIYYNQNIIINKNNIKKFIINFYFKLNNKEFIFPIESDLFNIDAQYTYELIENIINQINNKSITINNNSNEYIISLKGGERNNKIEFYMKNYELRFCNKKTLKPKFDLPPFSSKILLYNIFNEKISIICKNKLYIILFEKLEDRKEEYKEKIDGIEDKDEEEEEESEDEYEKNINKKIKIKINNNSKFDKNDNCKDKSFCLIL